MDNRKYFVTLSTGKDSEATLWYAYNNLPFNQWEVVFDDVEWDDQAVYDHLLYLEGRVGKKFIIVRNDSFEKTLTKEVREAIIAIFGSENIFASMVMAKGRFPSTKARFCTTELKVKPMIDFILDHCKYDSVIIQGVRAEESDSRRQMKAWDEYFKFYFEPFGYDKKGNPKFHTYRKKEVIEHCDKYSVDVFRPVLKKTANDVFNMIFENHSPGNKLYQIGLSRVGCYPCVMCKLSEIRIIATRSPERIEQIHQLELLSNSTFFPPGFIPLRFCSKKAKIRVYREDLIRLFGGKKPKEIEGQSSFFNEAKSLNPEETLYKMYFENEKIEVFIDEDGDEYIIRTVKVPTIKDVVKYVIANPDQVGFLDDQAGCVSVYNICESNKS